MQYLQGLLSLIGFVCFILVVVKMFQNGQTGLGIASILLVCCFGIGYLIAYVYGWVKYKDWNLMPVMLVWTGAIVLNIILVILFPDSFNQIRQQIPQQQ